MKRMIWVVLLIPLSISFGFIPFINPDSLKIYPLPHNLHNLYVSISPCTLNVLQDSIQLFWSYPQVSPPQPADSILKEAAQVCSCEINKAFYWAIGPNNLIKVIKIDSTFGFPTGACQNVQIMFIFGNKVE